MGKRAALGLLLVGALLRVWWLSFFLADPSTQFPHGNTGGFIRIARMILEGDLLAGDRPFFYGPLYSYYLAACFALTGSEGLLLPRLIQTLLGLLLAGLVWHITLRTFGEGAALAAGALMIFYGPALVFESSAVATTLSTVLLVLALEFLSSALDGRGSVVPGRQALGLLALAGAAFGLCAWGRGHALLLLPPVALWLLWRTPPATNAVRRLLPTLAFTLGACALILPVTARNMFVGGDGVLLVSQGGLNYFVGNNPDAPGFFSPPRAAGLVDDSDQAWEANGRRVAETQLGRELSPSEISRYWFTRGLDWVTARPTDAAALHLEKVLLLLDPYEIPIHRNAQVYLAEFPLGPALPGWALTVALAAAGLVLAGCRRDRRGLLLLLATTYGCTVLAFFVADRYRFPLVPLLAPFAGLALSSFGAVLRDRRRPSRRLCLAVLLAPCLFMLLRWDSGPLRSEVLSTELRGRFEALEYHRRAAAWERVGEPELALTTYVRALQAASGHIPSRLRQCDLLLDAGRTEEALKVLRILVEVAPQSQQAQTLLERAESASSQPSGGLTPASP